MSLNFGNIGNEGAKQGNSGDNSRSDGNTLGNSFGGVSNSIQVSHNLAGLDRLFIFHIMPGHLTDAIGIVSDGAV